MWCFATDALRNAGIEVELLGQKTHIFEMFIDTAQLSCKVVAQMYASTNSLGRKMWRIRVKEELMVVIPPEKTDDA